MNEYVLRFRGIQFAGCFGTSKKERSQRQIIIVDVDLDLPFAAIAKRDRRSDVVDYDMVVRAVVDEGSTDPVQLLETYVSRVIDRLFERTPALRIRVAARKLRAPTTYPVEQAIVEILRERG
ncbi:MAG TPA: dihydroneopterin aldolase [Polyangiaceae bacterium]